MNKKMFCIAIFVIIVIIVIIALFVSQKEKENYKECNPVPLRCFFQDSGAASGSYQGGGKLQSGVYNAYIKPHDSVNQCIYSGLSEESELHTDKTVTPDYAPMKRTLDSYYTSPDCPSGYVLAAGMCHRKGGGCGLHCTKNKLKMKVCFPDCKKWPAIKMPSYSCPPSRPFAINSGGSTYCSNCQKPPGYKCDYVGDMAGKAGNVRCVKNDREYQPTDTPGIFEIIRYTYNNITYSNSVEWDNNILGKIKNPIIVNYISLSTNVTFVSGYRTSDYNTLMVPRINFTVKRANNVIYTSPNFKVEYRKQADGIYVYMCKEIKKISNISLQKDDEVWFETSNRIACSFAGGSADDKLCKLIVGFYNKDPSILPGIYTANGIEDGMTFEDARYTNPRD